MKNRSVLGSATVAALGVLALSMSGGITQAQVSDSPEFGTTAVPEIHNHSKDYIELPNNPKKAKRYQLDVPSQGNQDIAAAVTAQEYRDLVRNQYPAVYDLNFVRIPLTGIPGDTGYTKAEAMETVSNINQRYRQLTNNKISFRFGSWVEATPTPAETFSCDLADVDAVYASYAQNTNQPTPPTDQLTVYASDYMDSQVYPTCGYLGIAMITGNILHLNGMQYETAGIPRSKGLQSWVLAHELGHNLGLLHSSIRWAKTPGIIPSNPLDATQDLFASYGDHLDVMGRPNASAFNPSANYKNWLLSSNSTRLLGIVPDGVAGGTVAGDSGTYYIKPLYSNMENRGSQALIIRGTPDNTTERSAQWVLEYRTGQTPVEQQADLNPNAFGTSLGVRLYAAQHAVSYQGSWYNVDNHILGFGTSAEAVRTNLTVGTSFVLKGANPSHPVTVKVLSQDTSGATVKVAFAPEVSQQVLWPKKSKITKLKPKNSVLLPTLTDKSISVKWSKASGKSCKVTSANGQYKITRTKKKGACSVTATAGALNNSWDAVVLPYSKTTKYVLKRK